MTSYIPYIKDFLRQVHDGEWYRPMLHGVTMCYDVSEERQDACGIAKMTVRHNADKREHYGSRYNRQIT